MNSLADTFRMPASCPRRECPGFLPRLEQICRSMRLSPPQLAQRLLCYRCSTASLKPDRIARAVRSACGSARIEVEGVSKGMSQQTELTSYSLAVSPAPLPGPDTGSGFEPAAEPQTAKPLPPRIPRWLERLELFLRVLLRMYIGLAVCYAPWSRVFWDQNPLFLQFPTLSVYASNGAVRGIVSGLGLLNLWIALQHVIHHRDE